MFWYKCSIIRERKMPGLKPIANDKILFWKTNEQRNKVKNSQHYS